MKIKKCVVGLIVMATSVMFLQNLYAVGTAGVGTAGVAVSIDQGRLPVLVKPNIRRQDAVLFEEAGRNFDGSKIEGRNIHSIWAKFDCKKTSKSVLVDSDGGDRTTIIRRTDEYFGRSGTAGSGASRPSVTITTITCPVRLPAGSKIKSVKINGKIKDDEAMDSELSVQVTELDASTGEVKTMFEEPGSLNELVEVDSIRYVNSLNPVILKLKISDPNDGWQRPGVSQDHDDAFDIYTIEVGYQPLPRK